MARWSRQFAVLVLCVTAAAPLFAHRLTISGYQTTTFRTSSVSGGQASQTAFQLDNFGYDQTLDNSTSLFVSGELLNDLYLTANVNRSRYSVNDSRYQLKYDGRHANITLGDLNANLTGNQFTSLSRSLKGVEVDGVLGDKFHYSFIGTRTKAAVRTDIIPGNNTAGPYYLTFSPILDGSEQVRVDEQVKVRGVDYVIDYTFGTITFTGVNIIPNTSTIAVNYEYDTPGQAAGFLYGFRAAAPLSEDFSLGYTLLQQRSSGQVAATQQTSQQREEFYGDNSPGPYSLTYRPLVSGSEVITVAGQPQTKGTDYDINYVSGLITFARPISISSLIVVDYTFETGRSGATANQTLMGLDGVVKLRGFGGLSFEMAQSAGGVRSDGSPAGKGMAFDINANGSLSKLGLHFGLSGVNSNFQRIENTGFQRNESGVDFSATYAASERVQLAARYNRFRSSSPLNFGVGGAFGVGGGSDFGSVNNNDTVTSELGLTASLAFPHKPQFQFSYQRMLNEQSGSENAYNQASLDSRYSLGKLQLGGTLNSTSQNFGNASASSAVTSVIGNTNNSTRSGRFSVAYVAGESLRFAYDLSANATQANGAFTSAARSQNFAVSFNPSQKLSITLNHYRASSQGSLGGVYGSSGGFIGGIGGYSGFGSSFGGGFGGSFSGYGSGYGTGYGSGVGTGYGSGYGGGYGTGYGGSYGGGYGGGYGNNYGSNYGTGYSGMGTGFGFNNNSNQPLVDPSFGGGSIGIVNGVGGNGGYNYLQAPGLPSQRRIFTLDSAGNVIDSRDYTTFLPLTAIGSRQVDTTTTTTSNDSNSVYSTLSVQYNPTDRLSFNANYNQQTNQGAGTISDSRSNDMAFGFSYRFSDALMMLGQFTNQRLQFLNAAGDTTSNIVWLGAQLGKSNGLNATLDWQKMSTNSPNTLAGGTTGTTTTTTGTTTVGTAQSVASDVSTITARLNYPLSRRLGTFLEYQTVANGGSGGGLSASNRSSLGLGLNFHVSRVAQLTVNYQKITSTDPQTAANSYSSNTLQAQMNLSFGSG